MNQNAKYRAFGGAAVVLIVLALVGCGGGKSTTPGSHSSGAPERGGSINVSFGEEVISIYPLKTLGLPGCDVQTSINESLFRVDSSEKNVPWLVKTATPSHGQRVWTFQLRPGVKFSNGDPMTSADVLFTLEQARKSTLWSGELAGVKAITTPSPETVVVTNSKPAPELPEILSQWSFGIMPNNFGGMTEQEFEQHPYGTGPFMLKAWKHGESISLVKNPYYWKQGLPYLDGIEVLTTANPESGVQQLKSGQLEMMQAPPWTENASIKSTPGLSVEEFGHGIVYYIGLNSREPLFQNPKIREAINLAVDREGVSQAAFAGSGEPASSLVAPVMPFFDTSLVAPSVDLEKAKSLVSEAVSEGVNPTFTMVTFTENPSFSLMAQIIQQNLNEAGITVKIQLQDQASQEARAQKGSVEAMLWSFFTDIPSQSEGVVYYNATDAVYTGADTKRTTEIAEEALSTVNEGAREGLYHEWQDILAEEEFVLPVVSVPWTWAVEENVTGLNVPFTGIPWFGEVSVGG